ncbi:MAG: hypothetical protein HGA80_09375, partial [Candidatus Omnitrophica bacterium]|nr:hypothetical protein [Candidatus Omnitrophota bacterium]
MSAELPVSAATSPVSAVAGKPAYGGTLVWGTTNSPTLINPILTQNSVSASLVGLIFNSLLRSDSHDQVVPDLAESWELYPDGRTCVFHLRKGVLFHDGVELTAEDVKFTYDAIADERNQSPLRLVAKVDGEWQVVDRYTVRLVLRSPDSFILRKMSKQIAPKHLLQNQDMSSAAFNYRPVGTGPFKFVQWDRVSNKIELAANTDYFEGRPYLDKIVISIYPDSSRLWAALMRREVDFVRYLNQDDYQVLSTDAAFRTYAIQSDYTCAIVYNLKDPILSDIRVREAIAMGIDVEKILQGIPASGMASSGPFQPNMPGFNPDVRLLPYDPVRAREQLKAQGWRDDGSGILHKAGQPLELRMLVDSRGEYFQKIAMLVRQQLSEIGIRTVVQLYS